jgi:hypothetical protein
MELWIGFLCVKIGYSGKYLIVTETCGYCFKINMSVLNVLFKGLFVTECSVAQRDKFCQIGCGQGFVGIRRAISSTAERLCFTKRTLASRVLDCVELCDTACCLILV